MSITFSIGDTEIREERNLLERRRLALPSAPPSARRDSAPPGWVLERPTGDDTDDGTTWAW